MRGGFCPHDWHGTTDADIEQMSYGEDYDFWADVAATTDRQRQRREYAVHDAAIAQAKLEGLTLHLLPMAEQNVRLQAAEDAMPTETDRTA